MTWIQREKRRRCDNTQSGCSVCEGRRGSESRSSEAAMAYLSMGEAHRRITEYLNRFSDAVLNQDGSSLKQLLSVSSNSSLLLSLADALNLFHDYHRLLKQSDRFFQISDIVSPLFRSIQNFRLGNLLDSYNAFEKAAKYLSFCKTLICLFI